MPQFLDLPAELIHVISEFLDDEHAINSLLRTNKRLFALLNHSLYLHNAQSPHPTALEWAARHGFERTVRHALKAGISPTEAYEENWVPLALACIHGHEDVARLLLELGVDPDLGEGEEWYRFNNDDDPIDDDHHHKGLVALAICGGHESIVKLLIKFKAPIDPQTAWDEEASLGLAVIAGHLPIIKLLVENGCKLEDTLSPLISYAVISGNFEIAEYLLDQGAGPDLEETESYICQAASAGHCKILILLVEYMLSEYASNPDGPIRDVASMLKTPLYLAVDHGHFSTAVMLRDITKLSEQVDSLSLNCIDQELLLLAGAACGWESIVRKLLEQGVSPDTTSPSDSVFQYIKPRGLPNDLCLREKHGTSALAFSAFHGHLGTTQLLLEYNASLGEKREEIYAANPLMVAVSQAHLPIVRALLDHGADPNYRQHDETYVLHQAVPSPEIFELLLDRGASADRDDLPYNISLLVKALQEGAIDTMRILQRRGILDSLLQDERGEALILAVTGGVRAIEYLLSQGYKVTPNSEEAQLALVSAIEGSNTEVINLLYARGLVFDLSVVDRRNLLEYIHYSEFPDIMEKSISTVETLLAHGVDITAGHNILSNLLRGMDHLSVTEMNPYFALLLDRGADPLQSRQGQRSPLEVSVRDIDNASLTHIMLNALNSRSLSPKELKKLAYVEAKARELGSWSVVRHICRIHCRMKYEGLPKHPAYPG
ncbi:hypothetical protein N7533_007752 [Penicillium manginii]|uniref:uncharacterized protein n=1 Tax=Penicillium manginii TaxID=203109 RepID=UPI002546685B|nr:uncharacterized protein N7533_007752 [Penicillium manginii]KAJ5750724.1 hypothetical protein N7533_007752 [Penicillium manginii]